MRYSTADHDALASEFNRDGLVLLKNHFPRATLGRWREAFEPLLQAQVENDSDPTRSAQRFYVMLPFQGLFAGPALHEDPDVLASVERVAGPDPAPCQLATDTPSFQLAVNFALCDVTEDNGPYETTIGTHRMNRADAVAALRAGTVATRRYPMAMGDVIRDVRGLAYR